MKIIRSFCLGKQVLLHDKLKLTKYLKLVQQTPIPYLGVKKAIGYDSIFNNLTFNSEQQDIFQLTLKLIQRDISELDFKEFTSYLSTINNFIANTNSQYPQNEQEFQEALRIILENGTFIQRFLAVQHIIIYYDKKITLYSQLATQLKDSLRDHSPKTTEERILKLFWEQLDIFDQQKIEGLIENEQQSQQNLQMKLDEKMRNEFLDYIDVIQAESESYNQATQLILYEIISRFQFEDVEISEKQIQQMYYISKQCQQKIEQKLSDLNNFHFVLYIHLLNLNEHEVNILSWDQIINELTIRDLTSMTMEDAFKIWLLFHEMDKQYQTVNDKLIEKLMNDVEKIPSDHYALLCQLLVETKNSKAVPFIKKWYPKIDIENESAENLAMILNTFNQFKLLNRLVLGKFLKSIEGKQGELDEISIENILTALLDLEVEHEITFERAVQLKLTQDTSPTLLISLLHYCQLFHQDHDVVRKIQELLVQSLEKDNDEEVVVEILRILVIGVKRDNQKNIEVIKELKPFIKNFLHQKDSNLYGSESQFRHLLQKLYNIK